MVYGFKLSEYTVIERLYDLDLKPLSCMLMFDRPGYPYRIYFKFDPEYKVIKEVYPLLIDGDVNKSIEVFKDESPYNGKFDFGKWAYLSYDLSNPPNQVYFDTPSGLKRYTGDEFVLDMEYENVSLEQLMERDDVPDNIKAHAKSLNADYVFLYWHDSQLVRFNVGITIFNPTYIKLRKEVERKLYS